MENYLTRMAFLAVVTQLADQKEAECVLQGSVIRIKASTEEERWSISTKIFDGDGFLPQSVRYCVSSAGVLRWQERGAFLKIDPVSQSVFLVQEIDDTGKYIPFRHLIGDFAQVAQEWREILEDFASRDYEHRGLPSSSLSKKS